MSLRRYSRIAVRATTVVAVLLLGMAALSVLEEQRTQAELGAVLSALFSNELLRVIHDSGSGRGIYIIVLREGPQSGIWRARWSLLFDRQPLFPQASPVTRSSFFLSNAVTGDTQAELHLPQGVDFVVVSRSELERGQPGDFERRFPNNMGYFAVSQAGFNFSKTEAILYIDHYCGGLCGGGGYILLRKVNGVWTVVDQHSVWVS